MDQTMYFFACHDSMTSLSALSHPYVGACHVCYILTYSDPLLKDILFCHTLLYKQLFTLLLLYLSCTYAMRAHLEYAYVQHQCAYTRTKLRHGHVKQGIKTRENALAKIP